MPDPHVPPGAVAVFSQAELARGMWQRFLSPHIDARSRAVRLATALEELGGVYAAFARFLCWRADLLPSDYLLALRRVRASAPPIPREDFLRILLHDVGLAGEELARGLETEPCWSTLQRCAYRAKYKGAIVAVQVAREPVAEKAFKEFAQALRVLDDTNTRRATAPAVVAQFREWLDTGENPTRERSFLTSIAESGESEVEYPRLVPEACVLRVLTWYWVDAEPLPDLISSGSATAALRKVAECVMEQLCHLALTDAELDPEALALTPEGKLVVRRANRLIPVPRSALPSVLKYVAAVLKQDAPSAAHQLIQLACSKPRPHLETKLGQRLSNLEPELKVNLRFPASAAVFESNWRGLAGLGLEKPLFLDSMHRNLVAMGYWNSEVAALDGPPEDMIAEAQWSIIGGMLRKRGWEMLDTNALYEWILGGGVMMVEGLRQVNRFAKGLRDNDLGVRISLDDHQDDHKKSNLALRQGILLGVLLLIFLMGMHWSSHFPAPVSTFLTIAASLAAAGVLWVLLRIG